MADICDRVGLEGSEAEGAARQLGNAMGASWNGDLTAVFLSIDAAVGRKFDDHEALALGLKLAKEVREHARIAYFGAYLLALHPEHSAHRVAFAADLLSIGEPHAAIDVVAPLLKRVSGPSAALSLKIDAVFATGDGTRIDAMLDELARRKSPPINSRFVSWVADIIARTGDNARAMAWLDRRWRFPQDAAFVNRCARILYSCGCYDRAEREFACLEEIASDPQLRSTASLFRARIARNKGLPDQAAAAYAKLLRVNPANAEAVEAVLKHHLNEGDLTAAADMLATVDAAAPMRVWLAAALATAQHDFAAAISIYREAIAAHPTNVEYYWRFADLLANLGDYDEMVSVLDQAERLAPGSPRVLAGQLRVARLREWPATEIVKLCERVLAVEPRNATAMLEHASALLRMNRRSEALDDYLRGAKAHPRNANFWKAAASLAVSLYRADEAQVIADDAARIFSSENIDELTHKAEIYEASGRIADALAAAETAIAIDSRAVAPRQIAARLWIWQGCYAQAWPNLSILKEAPNRSVESVAMLAQTAAGFRYLRPSQTELGEIEPIEAPFPAILFDEIVTRSRVRPREQCRDLMLHVTSTLAPGGAEQQIALTVSHFTGRKGALRVEFVADDLDPAQMHDFFLPIVERAEIPVHELRNLRNSGAWRDFLAREPEQREAIRVLGAMPRDLGRMALPLFVLFQERRPAVVHLWQDMVSCAGGLAAILAGVPRVILSMRSTRPIEPQRSRPYFHAAYGAFLRRPGISMLCNSRYGAHDYEDWLGLRRGTVEVIHNGCEFSEMRARTDRQLAVASRAEAGIPPDAVVIGGVMRCSFEKRPELWTAVACELASRDPRVYGILVGDGPMRPGLVKEVEGLALANRIRFVGHRSPVDPWIQAMDLLFLSSLTEGLPNVLIEAQSLGVAVATMRVGGAPETVDEGRTAVVIDEGSVKQVANAVGTLLFDPNRRCAYGQAGVEWTSTKFSLERMLDRLLEFYGGPIGSNPAAGVLQQSEVTSPGSALFSMPTLVLRPHNIL